MHSVRLSAGKIPTATAKTGTKTRKSAPPVGAKINCLSPACPAGNLPQLAHLSKEGVRRTALFATVSICRTHSKGLPTNDREVFQPGPETARQADAGSDTPPVGRPAAGLRLRAAGRSPAASQHGGRDDQQRRRSLRRLHALRPVGLDHDLPDRPAGQRGQPLGERFRADDGRTAARRKPHPGRPRALAGRAGQGLGPRRLGPDREVQLGRRPRLVLHARHPRRPPPSRLRGDAQRQCPDDRLGAEDLRRGGAGGAESQRCADRPGHRRRPRTLARHADRGSAQRTGPGRDLHRRGRDRLALAPLGPPRAGHQPHQGQLRQRRRQPPADRHQLLRHWRRPGGRAGRLDPLQLGRLQPRARSDRRLAAGVQRALGDRPEHDDRGGGRPDWRQQRQGGQPALPLGQSGGLQVG